MNLCELKGGFMVKRILIVLLLLSLIIGIFYYFNSQKTVDCWWGILYPSLSYIPIQTENDEDSTIGLGAISLTDNDYYFTSETEEKPFKIGFAIVEFFNKYLS